MLWRRILLPPVLRPARAHRPTGARGTAAVQELYSAFQDAPVAMAVLEPGGVLLRANAALGELLGRPLEALVGATLFEHTHPDDLDGAVAACAEMTAGRMDLSTLECRLLRPDGRLRRALVTTSLVRDRHGAPAHLVVHVQDVTERRALESELRHRALHDGLTGLPNRTLFSDRLEQAVAASRRDGTTFVLMFLDVDRFKAINDRFGHDVGDTVLIEVARRLREAVRPGDTAARLAGDEFLVLCPDVDGPQAEELRRRLLDSVCRPVRTERGELAVSVSAGLALGDARSVPTALLREADQHMYRAKVR